MSFISVVSVAPNSDPDRFLCRFPSLSLCDPFSRGLPWTPGESGLHLLHRCVRPRAFPPAACPHPGGHPGPSWEAVSHSLQSAEALGPGARSGAGILGTRPVPGSAGPDSDSLPAGLAAVSPADDESAAVTHQTSPAGWDGKESTSPPRTAAGQVT